MIKLVDILKEIRTIGIPSYEMLRNLYEEVYDGLLKFDYDDRLIEEKDGELQDIIIKNGLNPNDFLAQIDEIETYNSMSNSQKMNFYKDLMNFKNQNNIEESLFEIRIYGNVSPEMVLNAMEEIERTNFAIKSRRILQKYSGKVFLPLRDEFEEIIGDLNQTQRNEIYKELLNLKSQKNINEIRIVSTKHFPKDKDWVYKVNNLEEAKKLFKELDSLEYKWSSGRSMEDYPNIIDNPEKYPIYIGFMLDRGIVFSPNNRITTSLIYDFKDPKKLNF